MGRPGTVAVFVGVVALALSSATFIIAIRAQDALEAARHAEYRLCTRQMVNRAILDSERGRDEKRLPLYDCHPNLYGARAARLTPAQARVFVDRVRRTPEDLLP
jgi:hypothetical protein